MESYEGQNPDNAKQKCYLLLRGITRATTLNVSHSLSNLIIPPEKGHKGGSSSCSPSITISHCYLNIVSKA